jgi:hypothetical protein
MLAANQSLFMLLLNQVYVVGADNGQCMKYQKQQRRCHKLGCGQQPDKRHSRLGWRF